MSSPMSEERAVTAGETTDTQRIISDTVQALRRLGRRLSDAEDDGDTETIRWLHKRIVAIERDAQKRDAR